MNVWKLRTTLGLLIAVLALGGGLVGCSEKKAGKGGSGEAEVSFPEGLILASPPANAKGLGEVKKSASAGDTVTFKARIGGTTDCFIDGRAAMIVVDPALESCDQIHGDACETPWDYCCEPEESLTANTATVQIVDAAGSPLDLSLKGKHGMEELKTITVVGKVAQKNDEGLMVVNATGVHVAQ